jgi:hypothetical protein
MAKREKILLICATLALVFGALYLLTSAPGTKRPQDGPSARPDADREFLERLNIELQKEALSDAENYVLKRSALEWQADPTLGRPLSPEVKAEKLDAMAGQAFQYTGYVIVGSERIAIINGLEYMVGEHLVSGGYVVRTIEPERVVLEAPGKSAKIFIPFQGD